MFMYYVQRILCYCTFILFENDGILKIVKRICITEEKNPRRIVQEGIMMTRRQIQRIEERAYLAIPQKHHIIED